MPDPQKLVWIFGFDHAQKSTQALVVDVRDPCHVVSTAADLLSDFIVEVDCKSCLSPTITTLLFAAIWLRNSARVVPFHSIARAAFWPARPRYPFRGQSLPPRVTGYAPKCASRTWPTPEP
jgi:hypothetical protein